MRIRSFTLLAAAAGALLSLHAADTPFNLIPVDRFTPVMMHGRVSAARGWYMQDSPRYAYIFSGKEKYLSGEDCFELKCENGVFTFRFFDPLHEAYTTAKRPISFGTSVAYPAPPAPRYRTTGRIRFDRGTLALDNGIKLSPSPKWQTIDQTTRNEFREIRFTPAAGGEYSFADLRCEPVYPNVGGEIAPPTAANSPASCSPATPPTPSAGRPPSGAAGSGNSPASPSPSKPFPTPR